jgi:ATP-dependent Lhr-like helicase
VTQVISATPIAFFLHDHADVWNALRPCEAAEPAPDSAPAAVRALAVLRSRGASFAHEIAAACGLDDDHVREALAQLVACGLVRSDGVAGLRTILRHASGVASRRGHRTDSAGRWSARRDDASSASRPAAVEALATILLHRYGVMCRRLLARESVAVTWRELVQVYRRLEARGETRGGRFVTGVSGEQFALADAVDRLREVRRAAANGSVIGISAADPLNLTGIITAGERVRAVSGTRVIYRDGVPVAVEEAGILRALGEADSAPLAELVAAASRSGINPRATSVAAR